jgi:hypothetical protein
MYRIALISLLAIMAMLAVAEESYACSCLAPSPETPIQMMVSQAKEDSDAVFVGRVVSVRSAADASDLGAMASFVQVEVVRSWKGLNTKRVEIITAGDSAMCGVGFEVGKVFIIYANKNRTTEKLGANICSRTQMIGRKSGDEKYLGKRLKLNAK